jgi:hypothetical protein
LADCGRLILVAQIASTDQVGGLSRNNLFRLRCEANLRRVAIIRLSSPTPSCRLTLTSSLILGWSCALSAAPGDTPMRERRSRLHLTSLASA